MSVITPSWGDASDLLAEVGVLEVPDYYGPFADTDEKAVLTVPQRIQAAWERNDAHMFADIFTQNGSLLMRDDQLTSRAQIRAYMAAGFQGPYRGARVTGWPLFIRFISADVAMVVTQGGILLAGETLVAPAREIRATWVVVREPDGQLRLLSHQSSPIRG
jgi:uncharacterized protein (TIGR02246 family)